MQSLFWRTSPLEQLAPCLGFTLATFKVKLLSVSQCFFCGPAPQQTGITFKNYMLRGPIPGLRKQRGQGRCGGSSPGQACSRLGRDRMTPIRVPSSNPQAQSKGPTGNHLQCNRKGGWGVGKGAWLAPAVFKAGKGCHFSVQRLWATRSLSGLSQPLLVLPTISLFPAFFLLLQTPKSDKAANRAGSWKYRREEKWSEVRQANES